MRRRKKLNLEWLKQRWPALLLAALLSIAAGILVVRTSTIYALGSRADAAAMFAPNHPRVLAAKLEQQLTATKGQVNKGTLALAHKVLREAPMEDVPLLAGGIDALLKNDDNKARQFFSHALARNPRSEFTRLLMLELDLRGRHVEQAVADMTILGRLLPDVQQVFVPELARMARDPKTSGTLTQTLRSAPAMQAKVLKYLAENGASPSLVLQMSGGVPASSLPEEIEDWREPLLKAMVTRGQAADARRLWAAFAGIKTPPAPDVIYDEAFRGLPGLPPFNWAYKSTEAGAAEPNKRGGLEVEYYGRERGELATQLITLPPGRYRLGFHAEGDIKDPQHRIFWRISCAAGSNAQLVELPFANLTFAGRSIAGDFTVPANCPAQWLRLVGEPTEFPKIESATVHRIKVIRVPGAA